MRPTAVMAMGAFIALAALGTFLMYAVGGGMQPASIPSALSPIMLAGAICLLGAAYSGVILLRVNNGGSRKKLTAVTSLGILITVLAIFTPFPVGCNLQTLFNHTNVSQGCPASPFG